MRRTFVPPLSVCATIVLLQPEALRAIAGTTYIGTNAKAKRELGYNPRSMEDGFKEMLEYEMKVSSLCGVNSAQMILYAIVRDPTSLA